MDDEMVRENAKRVNVGTCARSMFGGLLDFERVHTTLLLK